MTKSVDKEDCQQLDASMNKLMSMKDVKEVESWVEENWGDIDIFDHFIRGVNDEAIGKMIAQTFNLEVTDTFQPYGYYYLVGTTIFIDHRTVFAEGQDMDDDEAPYFISIIEYKDGRFNVIDVHEAGNDQFLAVQTIETLFPQSQVATLYYD